MSYIRGFKLSNINADYLNNFLNDFKDMIKEHNLEEANKLLKKAILIYIVTNHNHKLDDFFNYFGMNVKAEQQDFNINPRDNLKGFVKEAVRLNTVNAYLYPVSEKDMFFVKTPYYHIIKSHPYYNVDNAWINTLEAECAEQELYDDPEYKKLAYINAKEEWERDAEYNKQEPILWELYEDFDFYLTFDIYLSFMEFFKEQTQEFIIETFEDHFLVDQMDKIEGIKKDEKESVLNLIKIKNKILKDENFEESLYLHYANIFAEYEDEQVSDLIEIN